MKAMYTAEKRIPQYKKVWNQIRMSRRKGNGSNRSKIGQSGSQTTEYKSVKVKVQIDRSEAPQKAEVPKCVI
jgi:hypothetical protein